MQAVKWLTDLSQDLLITLKLQRVQQDKINMAKTMPCGQKSGQGVVSYKLCSEIGKRTQRSW